ncbi:putative anion transporter 6 [Cardamine amara subsp. amara]|uniref:Anion transporter 6 n=1 Tax=Cardamine amara subsp. amara TaxID=228776 RepID=A0ABD1AS20_CARAN
MLHFPCILLQKIPWKSFFQSSAVWAMIYTDFSGSWGHYTCLSWLPTYFSEALNLNLREAAWVSILPPLASILVTSLASQFADYLITNGVETTTVRKILGDPSDSSIYMPGGHKELFSGSQWCQTIAFLSPALCMTLSSVDIGLPPWEIVGILTAGLALSSFALSGLYCTHQDISPEYASILLGITNSGGSTWNCRCGPNWFSPRLNPSWTMSLFMPSIFFYLTGTVVWLAFASSEPQKFIKDDS